MTDWRLGIDLGTSAIKLVVLDASGEVKAESGASHPTVSKSPGQAEQDPQDWLRALRQAIAALPAGSKEKIGAISVAGQMPTLVCLDASGDCIGPAITWQDSRADGMAAEKLQGGLHARVYARTGMPVDGRYLAPQFLHHFQDRRADVRRILSAKDYIVYALTGRGVTDPSTAAGYGVYALETEAWDAGLCAIWDLPVALLPDLLPTTAVAGEVTATAAADFGLPAGVPVHAGAGASAARALPAEGVERNRPSVALGPRATAFGMDGRWTCSPRVSALPG